MRLLCWFLGHKIGGVVDLIASNEYLEISVPILPVGASITTSAGGRIGTARDDYYVSIENIDPAAVEDYTWPLPQLCCARCGHQWDTTYDELEALGFIGRS